MRGKKYLWTLFILMFLASMAKISIPVTSSPTVTFKIDPAITTGVPVGSQVAVNVSIEADPGTAVVGWRLSIKVDPDVLKPGYWVPPQFPLPGYWKVAKSGSAGYFLYDWCADHNWSMPDPTLGPHNKDEMIGIRNETTGTITGTTESIKQWVDLGVGNGTDGTGTLVTFYFTSLNETAWSLIEITEAYYFTSWNSPDLDKHVPDYIINGHYNEPLEHDVAVKAVSAPPEATVGDLVPINVSVWNLGANNETFDLEVSNDTTVIETRSVYLALGASGMESFNWSTTGVDPGNYNITAKAILATDLDPSNDERTTTIELKTLGGDVAVTNVVPSESQVYPTWTTPLNITVTVLNNGTEPATFNVTAYYNETLIGTPQTVTNLAASAELNLTFSWNLTDVAWGLYTIKANATLLDLPDINPGNNEFIVYNAVKVKMPGDVDGNGDVKGMDLSMFASAWWSKRGVDENYNQQCDFDNDGNVKGMDLSIFASYWWKTTDAYPPDP